MEIDWFWFLFGWVMVDIARLGYSLLRLAWFEFRKVRNVQP
jgi:hypothetical protein